MTLRIVAMLAMASLLLTSHASAQIVRAEFNAEIFDQGQPGGDDAGASFFFGSFDGGSVTTNGTDPVTDPSTELRINTSPVGTDGFGGLGSNQPFGLINAFDSTTAQLEVTFSVGPNNDTDFFNIIFIDEDGVTDDGVNITRFADEHRVSIDIPADAPVDVFNTISIPLTSSIVFTQPAFDVPGDGVTVLAGDATFNLDGSLLDPNLNFGLSQIQIQTDFLTQTTGADPRALDITIESIQIIQPGILAELNNVTSATMPNGDNTGFEFGGISVDRDGLTFTVEANALFTSDDGRAGVGFVTGIDDLPTGVEPEDILPSFDGATHAIEIVAQRLATNTAESFEIVLADFDGTDDDGNNTGENFIFFVDTDEFSETEFTTFTIPLGDGTEDEIEANFVFDRQDGLTGGNEFLGDGLQNFDLTEIQLALEDLDFIDFLGLDVARISIVSLNDGLEGDFNGDGLVDAADYVILRDGGGPSGGGDIPADFALFAANFGAGAASGGVASQIGSVPEPTAAWLLLTATGMAVIARKKKAITNDPIV